MTQADKELLLKDLCARLPYGVKGLVTFNGTLFMTPIQVENRTIDGKLYDRFAVFQESWYDNVTIKPYLFPLSNMTEEQYHEMQTISGEDCLKHMELEKEWRNNSTFNHLPLYQHKVIEFFHKHHFDYRGLIPIGAAIDATNLNIY